MIKEEQKLDHVLSVIVGILTFSFSSLWGAFAYGH